MRILVISEGVPSRIGGGRSRQFNLIKALSSRHEYTVITYGSAEDAQAKKDLSKICEQVIVLDRPPIPRSDRSRLYFRVTGWKHTLLEPWPRRGRWLITPEARTVVTETLQRCSFDLVQVHQGYMAPLLPRDLRIAQLLDMHDVLSDFEMFSLHSTAGVGKRLGPMVEWRKMKRFEKRLTLRFDVCTVVSEDDRRSLVRLVPKADPIVVANGVDTDYFQPIDGQCCEPIVLFVGSLNYSPNETGVLHFCDKIWPSVKDSVPQAELLIVGASPSETVKARNGSNFITVVGEVPDVRPYFAQAAVSICPIYSASGTRLKILDAWSMEQAVVSTTLGAQGLDARHRENILLADTDDAFAQNVIELLLDSDLARALGKAGRAMVTAKYAWAQIAQQFQTAYERATEVAANRDR